MNNLSRNYVLIGLVWLVCAMAFGIWIGINQQLQFAESHAHFALVGFVLSVLFGLLHNAWPNLKMSRLAVPQFWIYEIGAVMLVAGKITVDGGGSNTLVKLGSLVTITGAALMLVLFFRQTRALT